MKEANSPNENCHFFCSPALKYIKTPTKDSVSKSALENRGVHNTQSNNAALIKGIFLENDSYLRLLPCFIP